MIESLLISNSPIFGTGPEKLEGLGRFNFIFGSNGTGKTTISRMLSDEAGVPGGAVRWKGGAKLQTCVYNRDFVEKNFNQSAELKGVFTLGEKQAEVQGQIVALKADIDGLDKTIENLTRGLQGEDGVGGKQAEVASLETWIKDKCWAQKQKHDPKFQAAFEGFRNNSERFKIKLFQEWKTNSASVLPLDELQKKAETVFAPGQTVVPSIKKIDATALLTHEKNAILKKRIIGKEDVDIAAMIKKLGNSDWVQQGRAFYAQNESVCPFCQQATNAAFAASLEAYFDETFLSDTKAIDTLVTNYTSDSARFQEEVATLIRTAPKFLDVEKLKIEKELLDSQLLVNVQRVAGKKKEPSIVTELNSLANIVTAIQGLIDRANVEVVAHNTTVNNLVQERETLVSQVWRFVLDELDPDLAKYKADRESLDKAVNALTEKKATATADRLKKAKELKALEKLTTSIQPTIDGINGLLSSFGFQSFKLAKAESGSSYKLIRGNGADAKSTLSEGERTFVTFLYFYHLLKGSDSENGMTTNRVVVLDDPVSSLDGDILFVVSSLIKALFTEVRTGTGTLKQVFIMTHNVYFHKEVTFNPQDRHYKTGDATFWIVRKADQISKIDRYPTNPVKTSYEMLWAELRKSDKSNVTIQNTLRRILENYFTIFGGIDPLEICDKFDGNDKLICRSLFAWVNDGSHSISDDLYVTIEPSAVGKYLRVFRAIFERCGHGAHYKMMMGDAFEEVEADPVAEPSLN